MQFLGTEGVIEASGLSASNGCKWLIAVEDDFAIEMKFEIFNVSLVLLGISNPNKLIDY